MDTDSEPGEGVESAGSNRNPARAARYARSRVGGASHSASAPAASAALPPPSRTAPPPPTSGWRRTFASFSNRDFLLLWLGMVFMMGGMQMQMVARGFLAWELTESAVALGIVTAVGALPLLLLGLLGGAVADRLERKRLVQGGQATAMVLALFVGVSITTGTITWYHLIAVSLMQGVLWAFLEPARQALISQLVGRENLGNAMALSGAGMSMTILIAPAIGGLLYVFVGPQGVYYTIGGVALTAVALSSAVTKQGKRSGREPAPVIEEIKEGLAYIRRNDLVKVLLVIGMVTVLFAMPFKFMMPVFVSLVYEREAEAFGLMVSMMGLGTLIGSLAIASIGMWRRGLLLILSTAASGVALLLVAAVPVYLAGLGVMVLMGLGDSGRRVLHQALLMEQVEDRYRGRVMSVFNMNFGLMPLGVVPVSLAVDRLGAEQAVAILGAVLVIVSIVAMATQRTLRSIA